MYIVVALDCLLLLILVRYPQVSSSMLVQGFMAWMKMKNGEIIRQLDFNQLADDRYEYMISHLLDFNQIDDSHNVMYVDMKLYSNSYSMVNDYLSISDYYRYESTCL